MDKNIGLFGSYIKTGNTRQNKVMYGGRRADTGSVFSKYSTPTGSNKTQCQKCEQYGHYTYECKNPRAVKSRPTRTQQLLNPKYAAKSTPSVEVPEEFKNKKGVADKILKEKEEERAKEMEKNAEKKRKRSSSSSSSSDSDSTSESSSSDSDSDSDSDSSDSDSETDSDSGSSVSGSSRSRSPPTKRRKSSRE